MSFFYVICTLSLMNTIQICKTDVETNSENFLFLRRYVMFCTIVHKLTTKVKLSINYYAQCQYLNLVRLQCKQFIS